MVHGTLRFARPFLFALSALLFSCAARYEVAVHPDGAAGIELSSSLGVRTAKLIANLSGSSAPAPDAEAVSLSLKSVAGVSAVSFGNPDSRTIAGRFSVSGLDRFLSPRFVRVERSPSGGRLSATLDAESAPAVLASLPPEIGDYLSALMAPVATGEKLSAEEYLALAASVYGEGVAGEIREARLRISLRLPGPAVSAKGGVVSDGRAEFVVPVLDLLTLERPISLEASWR